MFRIRRAMRILGAAAGIALVLPAQAQLVDSVCHGSANVLSQQQSGNSVELQVEVNIEDCEGVCIGSLEYKLLFTDAADNEIQWHMTEHWNWHELDGAFTLTINEDILPGATLKEIQEMRIGRCSCSTRVER
jgi:hypothetical protein